MIHKKMIQLMELQFYINNIIRCLGIVDLISSRRQYHHFYTLIKCATLFKIQLSNNYNYIQKDSVILSILEQSKIPTKLYS